MPANRFFCREAITQGIPCKITGAEHHHMRVMRVEVGDEVELINGQGALGRARIINLLKETTELQVIEVTESPQPTSRITLIIPLMRPTKLEWIVEKTTELGADALYLYAADFSDKETLSSNQLERLHHLCLSALKQSGRLRLPSLEVLPSLERALVEKKAYYFGDVSDAAPSLLKTVLEEETALITGPERGFSPNEIDLLSTKARGVSLSKNILRAETAPLVGLSVLALLR